MSEEVGRLRESEVVAEPERARSTRTKPIRDATSRVSDTRVRCMARVAKRGRTRSVALVTTERPVHERALSPAVREDGRLMKRAAIFTALGTVMVRNLALPAVESTVAVGRHRVRDGTLALISVRRSP